MFSAIKFKCKLYFENKEIGKVFGIWLWKLHILITVYLGYTCINFILWDKVNSQNAGMSKHGILTFQPADKLLFQQIKRGYSEYFLIAGSNYRSWKTAVKIDRTELSYHVNPGCFKITSTEMKKN